MRKIPCKLSNSKQKMTCAILLILFISILAGCKSEKNYKYVEIIEETGILGGKEIKEKEPVMIWAINDTTAYLLAYTKFCIAMKVNKDIKQSLGEVYSTPTKFKLYNEQNEDIIPKTFFNSKEMKEVEIKERIFSQENIVKEAIEHNVKEKLSKSIVTDSLKSKALEKYFTKKKDEFSNNNKTWYTPKTAPQFTNRNGIYCYFQTENGIPSNLRFRFQYYSDDWLFFDRLQFSIDGKAYEFIPTKTETDSGNGGYIWEWFDDTLTDADKELIYALSKAKTAKVKIIGKQYFDIKTISKEQITGIHNTLELYNALGGNY